MKKIILFGLVVMLVFPGLATRVPNFSLPCFDGSTFRMGEHIGTKIFIIDFWATWCQPCKSLLKRLQEAKNRHPGVEVIAISIDDAAAQSMAINYIKSKKYDFVSLFDADGQVIKMFNPTVKVPFTLIVDLQGEVVFTHAGYIPGVEEQIDEKIRSLQK